MRWLNATEQARLIAIRGVRQNYSAALNSMVVSGGAILGIDSDDRAEATAARQQIAAHNQRAEQFRQSSLFLIGRFSDLANQHRPYVPADCAVLDSHYVQGVRQDIEASTGRLRADNPKATRAQKDIAEQASVNNLQLANHQLAIIYRARGLTPAFVISTQTFTKEGETYFRGR